MAEQTADKVKFDKEEDIKPLLIAFRKIFEPITKSMQSIAKIPEEIKRVADNISKNVESGVPERVADGAEKLTTMEKADQMLRDLLSEGAQKQLENQKEIVNILQEAKVPSKLDENNQAVKLTEKEITESRKEFITLKNEQSIIEKKIEVASKAEGSDAEQQAEVIQKLKQELEESRETTTNLETILGNKTPQEIQQQERPGFQTPAFLQEPYEMGKESLMAGPNAFVALKDSFENNIGGPIKSLLNMNKEHHEVMEDYGETGEKSDKMSLMKFLLIAAGITTIVTGLTYLFRSGPETKEDAEMSNFEKNQQEEYNRMRNAGLDEEESALQGKRTATKEFREGFIDIPGILGMRDEETDILNTVPDSTIEGAKNRMMNRKATDGSIGELYLKNQKENAQPVNNIITTNTSNNTTQNTDKPSPYEKPTVSQG